VNSDNVPKFNRFIPLILIALITGCATTPKPEEVKPETETPIKTQPTPVVKPSTHPSSQPPQKSTAKPQPISPAVAAMNDQKTRALVVKLLPAQLQDKNGWADDLQSAFKALQIQPDAEHFCASIAIIGQESTFQADPVVPGLPNIIRREIEQRRDKYSIPQKVVDWMLASKSRDGRTFNQRIDVLRTEKELSDLIEEIVDMVPAGKELFPNYNPVHTGGPMQVSVDFAESHVKARPYPYPIHGNLRNEVFSRRGGVYFGSAILLDYPIPYDDMLYVFADFNAGRYTCRNAAFQQALSRISGKPLATDGDLLRYKNGAISPEASSTLMALRSISGKLKLNETEIQRDLRLEKLSSFNSTPLYTRLFALADQSGPQARFVLPQIDLKSPKIKRKLTTEWFAHRVYGRYQGCLQQGGITLHAAKRNTHQ
jgi:hypothetical protein